MEKTPEGKNQRKVQKPANVKNASGSRSFVISELVFWSGRLNRLSFFLNMVVIIAIYVVAQFIIAILSLLGTVDQAIAPFLLVPIHIVFGFMPVAFLVRRLHDLDRPGWHYFLFLIPLYNIYLTAVVFFAPGTVGNNNYGMDPLEIKKKGITPLEPEPLICIECGYKVGEGVPQKHNFYGLLICPICNNKYFRKVVT